MSDERRETERAIRFWQQRIGQFGYPPLKPTDLQFEDLIADGGENRFIIGVDHTADDHLLFTYGSNFARLLGLRTGRGSSIRLIHEIPDRFLPTFIQGCRDAALGQPPVRIEGEIDVGGGRHQLYRAVFMPIGNSLVFGAFNSGLTGLDKRSFDFKRVTARDIHSEEAAIAAFIRLKGITRCPTAYAVPTRGTVTPADQAALERYAADRERSRRQKSHRLEPVILGVGHLGG